LILSPFLGLFLASFFSRQPFVSSETPHPKQTFFQPGKYLQKWKSTYKTTRKTDEKDIKIAYTELADILLITAGGLHGQNRQNHSSHQPGFSAGRFVSLIRRWDIAST
jgi:hypothetical protein